MRKFIFALIILLLSVWLGLKIAEDPGLAFFSYRGWSLETPLWFAVVCLLLLMVAIYWIVHIFDSVDSSFYRWKNWLRWRRQHKAYSKTNHGLVELIECHWKRAENYLLSGIAQSDAPLINYLAAAKAAHEYGAYDKRDNYLRKARDCAPKADVAISLTQAQLQFDQGQFEQARVTLDHVRQLLPLHPVMLTLLEKINVHLADWKSLLQLIPSLRKARVYNDEHLDKLEHNSYQALLKSKAWTANDLREIWQSMPRRVQKNVRVVYCYAQEMLKQVNATLEVEELIYKTVKHTWDADLVLLYGQFRCLDPKRQLHHAEKWQRLYPHQAVLLLTLGRLAMNCQLWGKARGYFENSLKCEVSPAAYFEYAKLLEQLGETTLALRNYHEGAILMS